MSSIAESASLRAMENGKRGIGIQTAYLSFLAVAASSTLTSHCIVDAVIHYKTSE